MIHAVGRASTRAPRLIDLTWGKASHPKVTLVGKGVCFDTGGLDLKPAAGMLNMKKDMGGAAHDAGGRGDGHGAASCRCGCALLVPAVENSVSGNAFRPLDVVPTRKGITRRDRQHRRRGPADPVRRAARGRDARSPTMMVDCATLTGAARVALGPDLPALFCNDDALADGLLAPGERGDRPDVAPAAATSPIAACSTARSPTSTTSPGGTFAGAITAALYLQEFVPDDVPWAHFDMMAWNNTRRPGRPEGGEAQAARAIFATIEKARG